MDVAGSTPWPVDASWLFRVAPYFGSASTWVAAALIPTFAANLMFSWTGDLTTGRASEGSCERFAIRNVSLHSRGSGRSACDG
jgi:hypothetical protein